MEKNRISDEEATKIAREILNKELPDGFTKDLANTLTFRHKPKEKDEIFEMVGYIFEDRFYKSIFELEGKTMNEENKPMPVFKKVI
jgi:hypothetical protein